MQHCAAISTIAELFIITEKAKRSAGARSLWNYEMCCCRYNKTNNNVENTAIAVIAVGCSN